CQDAIRTLEKSMSMRKGGDSFDWFFLAMAHWRLGEVEKARQWHEKALAWMEKRAPKHPELLLFRAEAQELMKQTESRSSGRRRKSTPDNPYLPAEPSAVPHRPGARSARRGR